MLLVDLKYNFECDWFVELFDNKLSDNMLSDNNLASELVENRSFLNQ